MLFGEDPYTKHMMLKMLIDFKGKDWRVMTAPKNPTNTNFLDIVTTDLIMRTSKEEVTHKFYYTIDIQGRLHQRMECNCEFKDKSDRVVVNFNDAMGLPIKDIKFLGENDMNLTLAPCMIDDEV